MHILASRKRTAGAALLYEYRLVTPLHQLPPNRVVLIATRSDFGVPGGYHARLRDVIAPLDWLRMEPCPAKRDLGRDIERVAKHLEAAFLTAIYPEIIANPISQLVELDTAWDDSLVDATINEITDGYRFLRNADLPSLTAERFQLAMPARPEAA